MVPICVIPAGNDHLVAVRKLIADYADEFSHDQCFFGIQEEIADLPWPYSPLLVATIHTQVVGCIGLRELESGTCEMKRLYVQPEFRGQGIARKLAEALIQDARVRGYQRMRLDTIVDSMQAAIGLYRDLGFVEIAPYNGPGVCGIGYFELQLVHD